MTCKSNEILSKMPDLVLLSSSSYQNFLQQDHFGHNKQQHKWNSLIYVIHSVTQLTTPPEVHYDKKQACRQLA